MSGVLHFVSPPTPFHVSIFANAVPARLRAKAAASAATPAALAPRAFHFSSPRAKMTAQVKAVRQRASAPRGKGVRVPRSFHYCKRRREDIGPLFRQDAGAGRRPRGGIASQETCPRAAAGTPGTGERRLFSRIFAFARRGTPSVEGGAFLSCASRLFFKKGGDGGGRDRGVCVFPFAFMISESRRKS